MRVEDNEGQRSSGLRGWWECSWHCMGRSQRFGQVGVLMVVIGLLGSGFTTVKRRY